MGATLVQVPVSQGKPQHKKNSYRQHLNISFTKRNDLLADFPVSKLISLLGRRTVWIFCEASTGTKEPAVTLLTVMLFLKTSPGLSRGTDKACPFSRASWVQGVLPQSFKSTVYKAKEYTLISTKLGNFSQELMNDRKG